MLTIKTCAGIGDGIFLIQKLINAKEKFRILLPDGKPQRGKQIWDLLPKMVESCVYVPGLNYRILNELNTQRDYPEWKELKKETTQRNQDVIHLSANEWLETGNRINGFFPDLKTSYAIDWNIKPYHDEVNRDFGAPIGNAKLIGIYGSTYSSVRQWGFWNPKKWMDLIKKIHAERPEWKFVIIGATFDKDFADEMIHYLTVSKIPYVNTIGKELGYVGEMMKKLHYAFYFPSGLPIFSESIRGASDCTMFYPPHLTGMMGTWCDLSRKNEGYFKECLFCEPDEIFKWVRDTYQIFDR